MYPANEWPGLPEPKVYQMGFDLIENWTLTKSHQRVFVSTVLLYIRDAWTSSLIFHGLVDSWTRGQLKRLGKVDDKIVVRNERA